MSNYTQETTSAPMSTTTSAAQSRRSSITSGISSFDSAHVADQNKRPTVTATMSSGSSVCSQGDLSHPLDPLSRKFPKPAEEVNVAEMLERKPLKWTLGHYIKTPTKEASDPFNDKDKVAQNMEAKKVELLAAKEEMRRLAGGQ